MKILLINQNATVEKLVRLSAAKVGLEVVTAQDAGSIQSGEYAWVLVDHETLKGAEPSALKAKCQGAKVGLLHPKNGERTPGFDLYIEKPFLPTELIDEFSARMGGAGTGTGGAAAEALDMELPDLDGDDGGFGDLDLGDTTSQTVDLGDLSLDDDLGGGSHDDLGSLDMGMDDSHEDLGALDLGDDLGANLGETAASPGDLGDAAMSDDLGGLDELSLDGLHDSASSDTLEDLSLDLNEMSESETEEMQVPSFEEDEPIAAGGEEAVLEADELSLDRLGMDETSMADEDTFGEDLSLEAEPADAEPKISILDKEEVEKVKELLSEDSLDEDTLASSDELSLGGEEDFAGLLDDDKTLPAAEGDEMKLELGENSALLDEDDLADLHKSGHDLDDEALLDDSFGEMEEIEEGASGIETLEDSLADSPMPEFDFSEAAEPSMGAMAGGMDEDLQTLSEESVAMALGEELPAKPAQPKPAAYSAPVQNAAAPASSLEGALATLSPGTLRELLDGMQLTINITFPNKKS